MEKKYQKITSQIVDQIAIFCAIFYWREKYENRLKKRLFVDLAITVRHISNGIVIALQLADISSRKKNSIIASIKVTFYMVRGYILVT